MEMFSFRLIDRCRMIAQISVPLSTSFGRDLLNTLCGAKPIEWIGNSSHHKLICLGKDLKSRLLSICDNNHDLDVPKFRDYISQQPIDSYLAFVRLGALLKVDDKLMAYATHVVVRKNLLSKYTITEYGNAKIHTGEPVFKNRVCRFCGRSNPEVKFKDENAHAIPDALGNKNVFCYDECTECNGKLAPIEKQLIDYLNYRRSENGIKNKRNKVVHVTGHNFDFDGPTHTLKITKYAILAETENQYFVKLEGAEPISHLGIYKALCKIALDLIPRNLIKEYASSIKWIRGGVTPMKIPNVLYCYHKDIVSQPNAKIYLRCGDKENEKYPLVLISLRIMDLTFLYVIPFGKDTSNTSGNELLKILAYLIPDNAIACETLDMDDRIGKFAHVTEWVDKTDCVIIDQKDLDHVQEKNPNKVEFPEFKSNNVSIISNNIKEFSLCDKEDIRLSTEIKDCGISYHSTKFIFPKESNTIGLKWSVSVENLHREEVLFTASGSLVARLKDINKVVCRATNEISSFFIEYMLSQAFIKLEEKIGKELQAFDFNQLADLFMQSDGMVMHPLEHTPHTSMTPYLKSIHP